MADYEALRRSRREALHQKQYGPSILDRIWASKSEQEIHNNLLRALRDCRPSAKTRRRWKEAASIRAAQLRIVKPRLVLPPGIRRAG